MNNCAICGGAGSLAVPFSGTAKHPYTTIKACGFCDAGKKCHPSYPVMVEPLPFPRVEGESYQLTLMKIFSEMSGAYARRTNPMKQPGLFDHAKDPLPKPPQPPAPEKALDISSGSYPDDLKAPALDVYVMVCDHKITMENGAHWLARELLSRNLPYPPGLATLADLQDEDSMEYYHAQVWKKVKEYDGLWKGAKSNAPKN